MQYSPKNRLWAFFPGNMRGIPAAGRESVEWKKNSKGEWYLDFRRVSEWLDPGTLADERIFERVNALHDQNEEACREKILRFALNSSPLRGVSGEGREYFSEWKMLIDDVRESLIVWNAIQSKATPKALKDRIEVSLTGDVRLNFRFSKSMMPFMLLSPEQGASTLSLKEIATQVLIHEINARLPLGPTRIRLERNEERSLPGRESIELRFTQPFELPGIVWAELAMAISQQNLHIILCETCHSPAVSTRATMKYCSPTCRNQAHRRRKKVVTVG